MSAASGDAAGWARLTEIFENPELQMASFTITEKGYALRDIAGKLLPIAIEDMKAGPANPKHIMAAATALLLARYNKNAASIAMVSMDNCSHNGDILRGSVLDIAKAWCDNGFAPQGFVQWLSDSANVSFPWSMIDKITPRPNEGIAASLEADGIEGMQPVITSKGTYTAAFVNAEGPQYLVIEDSFPNSRPPLEDAGVIFTNRETVDNVERMKVTTCLNPLHTALAVFGCLLGHKTIAAEMSDAPLRRLVEKIGYDEAMPVVVNPGVIDPQAFISEVLSERFPNPYMPDAPQRIASDTSLKIGIRFGETIKSYRDRDGLDPAALTLIPLVIAGWMRFLLGMDDDGNAFEIPSDPMKGELQAALAGIEFGKPESYSGQLEAILRNETLFGVDLFSVNLGEKIEGMFCELIAGAGAVRTALEKYTK